MRHLVRSLKPVTLLATMLALAGAPRALAGACPTTPGAPDNSGGQDFCAMTQFTWAESTGAANYEVYRDGRLVGGTSYHGFTDTEGLAPNTYYTYQVVAVGPAPDPCRVAGPESVIHTKLKPSLKPAPPVFDSRTCSTISFRWVPPSEDVNKADVWRYTGPCGTGAPTLAGLADNPTLYVTDSLLDSHTEYGYYLVPVDYCDQRGPASDCATFSTTPLPPAPGAPPSLTNRGCRSLSLDWAEAAPGTWYHLWRRDAGCDGGEPTLVGTTPDPRADDANAEVGHTYGYFLAYENECHDVGPAGPCAAYRTRELPDAPGNVSSAAGATGVDLAWSAAAGANSYDVLRGTEPGCAGALDLIANTPGLTLHDGYAVPGVAYYYIVRSVGDCGTTDAGCVSGTRYGPAGVPDGSAPGRSPVRGSRISADGSAIAVTWDPGCGTEWVRLVYGRDSDLPSAPGAAFTPLAGSCYENGAAGAMTWYGVPEVAPGHMIWWLVYGVDGGGFESSWGRSSSGAERAGPGPGGSSGQCGTPGKVANHPCR